MVFIIGVAGGIAIGKLSLIIKDICKKMAIGELDKPFGFGLIILYMLLIVIVCGIVYSVTPAFYDPTIMTT